MMKAGFFDIDGTLINVMRQQTRITEPTRAALHRLRAAGCKTFIASGRPKAYLDPELLDESLFDGYVLMNGALVLYEGKALYHQPLPKETVKAITELCEQRGVEYILEGAEHTYLKREFLLSPCNFIFICLCKKSCVIPHIKSVNSFCNFACASFCCD